MASGFSDTSKMTAVAPRCTALFACKHTTGPALDILAAKQRKPRHFCLPDPNKPKKVNFLPLGGVICLNVPVAGANKGQSASKQVIAGMPMWCASPLGSIHDVTVECCDNSVRETSRVMVSLCPQSRKPQHRRLSEGWSLRNRSDLHNLKILLTGSSWGEEGKLGGWYLYLSSCFSP